MSSPASIPMFAPDGSLRWVPNEMIDKAAASGGQQAVRIIDPQGVERWAPKDKAQEYLKAGAKLAPAGAAEKAIRTRNASQQPSAVGRFLKPFAAAFTGAVKGLDPRPTEEEKKEGLTNPFDYAMRPFERVAEAGIDQAQQARDAAKKGQVALAIGHGLAAATPAVGPWAAQVGEEIGKDVGSGNIAGALGAASGNAILAAAPKVAETAIPPVARALSEGARETLRRTAGVSPEDLKASAEEGVEANLAHAEQTHEAVNEQQRREDAEKNALRNKAEEIAGDQEAKRKAVLAKNRAVEREHAEQVAKTREENAAALREQAKVPATRGKLDTAVKELRAQIETAREKALRIGNQKYSALNEKLNPLPADNEAVMDATAAAAEKIKGSQIKGAEAKPRILEDMADRIQKGDAFTYEDLQGYYSELNRELSKGTLPGDVYAAYDTLHDAIGDEMQRIADSQGAGAQLLDARNYWRRMKQTFGKPWNPTDAANVALEKAAGSAVRDAEQDNRLRLLGSFDKSIPQTAEHIANLQKGLKALPEEKPVREVVKVPPAKPAPIPAPRFAGTPEELARQAVPQPERPEFPNRPDDVNPQAQRVAKILERGHKMTNSPTASVVSHALTGFGSTWALVEALRGELSYAGAVIASRVLIAGAQRGLGALLENPGVAEWLAKPSKADLAVLQKLTPEQRGAFGQHLQPLLAAAAKRGITVSPALAAIAGGTIAAGASQPRKPVAAALTAIPR